MGLPYQCLSILGRTSRLCAAKGPSIHTFDLDAEPPFLSSWTHPLTTQPENGKVLEGAGKGEKSHEQMTDQPPIKRRKLDSEGEPNAEADQAGQRDDETAEGASNGKGQKKPQKKPKHASRAPSELPFVILLTATEDGSYVVAVTGQDKTLWVFEHDGEGVLKELSQRVMPKRPSSLAITSDGETILCADKFGDVYALPLIPPAAPEADVATATPSDTPASAATSRRTVPRRGANALTVHSQRNMRALEDQRRHLASQQQGQGQDAAKKEDGRPAFKHEPVLGHVSMLTAVVVATAGAGAGGRPYIVTADRDEHVRVSRGLPQAHVVEAYCLGHGAFVSALVVPRSRPDTLVSGGGDDALFVWDWRAGRLRSKADLLGPVRRVVGADGANKIAVSRLYSYDVGQACYVMAICERVPATFVFQLQPNNTLEHVQTLTTSGIPLDAAVLAGNTEDGQPPRLIIATDPNPNPIQSTGTDNNATAEDASLIAAEGSQSPTLLLLLEQDASSTTGWVRRGSIQGSGVGDDIVDVSREELEKVLYPVENLRKTEFEDDGEGEGEQAGGGSAGGSVAP
ncbi:hypothetical protein F4779DRAFT_618524 [Xylariaceae sp. FL0662B]|nr:hypothetical protein F4779DRAFT_618524 [Xylariaceae sp. FL0662B]